MHLVLKALGIGPGDEVVTPSMTWASTVNLITLMGATPVFADIDRDTLMVTPASVAAVVTSRTRLIIPVHFAGAAVDQDPIRAMAETNGITVVEDAAHAIGTRYKGSIVGGTGTSVFSFHPIKSITTGEGGMVCSDDQRLLTAIRRLRFHGLGVDAWDRTTQGRKPQAEVLEPGFKYNLTDISAALGIGQLARVHELNQRRRDLAELYLAELGQVPEIQALRVPETTTEHAWSLFVVCVLTDRRGVDRDQLMEQLKHRGIGTGLHFRAVHLHSFYQQNRRLWRGELPETEWSSKRILSLPLFPAMTDDDVRRVVTAIKEIISSC
jgi:UDP-4-amino-4-deoxy-L-arabinose-oxoglutarate aminotransferase